MKMSPRKSVWAAVLVLTAIFVKTSPQHTRQGSLDACPDQCKCGSDPWYDGVMVSCEGKNLTSIPQQFPLNTTTLYLSYNQLQNLSAGLFDQCAWLEWLNLRNNQLKDLPEDIFRYNTELEWL